MNVSYLAAYTTALQNAKFTKGYIDAFAGSGYRDAKRGLPDLSEQEPQELLEGSARRALRVQPRFDGYVFIESHAGRRAQLEALKSEFPEQANAIQIRGGDASQQLQEICALSWASRRAVLFLDPYGMQVDWSTIEAVAATDAIDMWLLFPVGIGVNRLLKRDADIPDAWRDRLSALLGTDDWFDEFYRTETFVHPVVGFQVASVHSIPERSAAIAVENTRPPIPGPMTQAVTLQGVRIEYSRTVREQIMQALEDVPPHATFEDAIERLVFLANIDEGLGRARPRQRYSPRRAQQKWDRLSDLSNKVGQAGSSTRQSQSVLQFGAAEAAEVTGRHGATVKRRTFDQTLRCPVSPCESVLS